MLTVAYCRVSTEEQAEEGFSIAGQADKLKVYAELHDLGEVVVITDPGLSGKNLDRPGLQRLLEMVERGHVGHVLVWRLDRLSRNLGDLSALADTFVAQGVTLHSFTEKIDLSSATGRMFYNVLGSFAQFYREQLAENVRMGMHQAIQQGRWINRAKTGYDMRDGLLVPNEQAPLVREIFRLRAEGLSHQRIEERTGVKYSTVRLILLSRIYLGEVLYNGEWSPGTHEPLITPEQYEAAHRGFVPGRRRLSREILSGRVRCGLCQRLAAVEYRQNGEPVFRCKHRGQGCSMPRRAAWALERAVLLGLRLLGDDAELREAIRREIGGGVAPSPKGRANDRADARRDGHVAGLETKRRKLLELHYADKIGADLYAEEELRLRQLIDLALSEQKREEDAVKLADDVSTKFEQVATLLASLDVEAVWKEATQDERRILVSRLATCGSSRREASNRPDTCLP